MTLLKKYTQKLSLKFCDASLAFSNRFSDPFAMNGEIGATVTASFVNYHPTFLFFVVSLPVLSIDSPEPR
jgi:hypothetical protein